MEIRNQNKIPCWFLIGASQSEPHISGKGSIVQAMYICMYVYVCQCHEYIWWNMVGKSLKQFRHWLVTIGSGMFLQVVSNSPISLVLLEECHSVYAFICTILIFCLHATTAIKCKICPIFAILLFLNARLALSMLPSV